MALKDYKIADNIWLTSSDTVSPFTFTVDSASSTPEVGSKIFAVMVQKSDYDVYAHVMLTISTSTTCYVDRVLESSDGDDDLPAFSGPIAIRSAYPTPIYNKAKTDAFGIFMGIGQSNLVATSTTDSFDALIHTEDMIYQYAQQGTYNDSVSRVTTGLSFPGAVGGGAGLIVMMRKWLADTNHRIPAIAVPSAVGNTGYFTDDWNPGDTSLANSITAVNEILTAYPNSFVVAIVDQMGERDSEESPTEASYRDDTIAKVAYIRAQINTSDGMTTNERNRIPFIAGGMAPAWLVAAANTGPVQDAIENFPNTIEYSAYASSAGLTSEVDDVHMTLPSLVTLGERYFTAYHSAVVNKFVATAPGAVTNLAATMSAFKAILTWDEVIVGYPTPTYSVERALGAGAFSEIATGLTLPTYTDTGLAEDTAYRWRVTATTGTSPDSVSSILEESTPEAGLVWGKYLADTGITEGATFIWANQGTTGPSATQSTASNQPVDNGATGVTFVTNDHLIIGTPPTVTGGYTRVAKFRFDSASGQYGLMGDDNIFWIDEGKVSAGTGGALRDVADTTVLTAETVYTFAVTHSASGDMNLYNLTSGTAVLADSATGLAAPTSEGAQMVIGDYDPVGTTVPMGGEIINFAIHDSVMTVTELEDLEASW